MQNADDAKATKLFFFLLKKGSSQATHPLLHEPALVIYNNGPLEEKDCKGITRLIGGAKQNDANKIGRFGLGLKSLFHICEGFFFDFFPHKDFIEGKLLDPWKELRDTQEKPNSFCEWDDNDCANALKYIRDSFAKVSEIPTSEDGFLLYAPLRSKSWKEKYTSISLQTFTITEFQKFMNPLLDRLVLSLVQCASLNNISVYSADSLQTLERNQLLYRIAITNSNNLLSRPSTNDEKSYIKYFSSSCEIEISKDVQTQDWKSVGIERYDPNVKELRDIFTDKNWPKTGIDLNKQVPVKALPHAAITVARQEKDSSDAGHGSLFIRWASFLPFDDRIKAENMVKEILVENCVNSEWDILLHGYFWPSEDRKSLPGLLGNDNQDLTKRWNKQLAHQLLLPLLPKALEKAFEAQPFKIQQSLVHAVREWCKELDSVCKEYSLVLLADSSSYTCVSAQETMLEIPRSCPPQILEWIQKQDIQFCILGEGLYKKNAKNLWTDKLFTELFLNLPHSPTEITTSLIGWINEFLEERIRDNRNDPLNEKQKDALAKWIIQLLKNRAFRETSSVSFDVQRRIFDITEKFIGDRVFFFLRKTEFALQEIANNEEMSSQYILLPMSDRESPADKTIPNAEQRRLLKFICNKLKKNSKNEAYISLADKFCSHGYDAEFCDAPMYRVFVFDFDRNEGELSAKSYNELKTKSEKSLLFLRSEKDPFSNANMDQLVSTLEYGTQVWLMDEKFTVPSGFAIGKDIDSIWNAVCNNKVSSDEKKRMELIKTYINASERNPNSYKAIRKLIAGKEVDDSVRFVFGDMEEEKIVDVLKDEFFFLTSDYNFLDRNQQIWLHIGDSRDVEDDELKVLLDKDDAWHRHNAEAILSRCKKVSHFSDELRSKFMKSEWIPANRERRGYALSHILYLQDDTLIAQLKDSLPAGWTTQDGISYFDEFHSVLDKIIGNDNMKEFQHTKIKEIFTNEDFKPSKAFFPSSLRSKIDDTFISWLKEMARDGNFSKGDKLLLCLIELPLEILRHGLQKFCGSSCFYESVMQAAFQRYANNTKPISDMFYYFVMALFTDSSDITKIFKTDTCFPTRSKGVWKKGSEIVRANTGYDDDVLLDKRLWNECENKLEDFTFVSSVSSIKNSQPSFEILCRYFNNEFGQQNRINVFLYLLAGRNKFTKFEDNGTCEDWWNQFLGKYPEYEELRDIKIHIDTKPSSEGILMLSRDRCTLERKNENVFFEQIEQKPGATGNYYEILLCSDSKKKELLKSAERFETALKNTFFAWGETLKIERGILDKFWENNSATQVSLKETVNLLKNDLHAILSQLKIKNSGKLLDVIRELRDEVKNGAYSANYSNLQGELWEKAKSDSAILEALRQKIHDYGYRIEGVLLELLQNADDALYDMKQISNSIDSEVSIKLDKGILSFTHYGRPINEQGKNRNRAWGDDLYNMLVLNLSGKTGEC